MSREQQRLLKKKTTLLGILSRLEGRPVAELVSPSTAPTCWLVALNASYDSGITGEQLEAAFAGLDGFDRVEMFLGSKPYSYVHFCSAEQASAAYATLDGKPVDAWQGKTALLAFAAPGELPDFPQRPLTTHEQVAASVPGLSLVPEFVTKDEEQILLANAEAAGRSGRWESLSQRRVQHFGFRFDYPLNDIDRAAIDVDADTEQHRRQAVLPDWAGPVLDRYTSLFPQHQKPDQLTINHYVPGGGIAPHTDRHTSFLSPVLIVSLGAGLVMEFRQLAHTSSHEGAVGMSLVVMDGEARLGWEHAIRPRKMDLLDGKVVERSERWS
ncbi:hypothetical protein BC831DRAFT_466940 [Entophlyctis helioformis]|nr:hypothetical protein BC831DRAFT_466940 [Entophlyctis helioformis]